MVNKIYNNAKQPIEKKLRKLITTIRNIKNLNYD